MRKVKRITVRADRKKEPDIRRLSRAIIQLVAAQAEADARAEHQGQENRPGAVDSDDRSSAPKRSQPDGEHRP